MINIVITSYNEPKATLRSVNSFLKQKINKEIKVIVCDPFEEVGTFIKSNIKDKRVEFFLDPGEGKSYALNLILKSIYSKNKSDIIVFTDGDVFVSSNSLQEISNAFDDSSIGCITGKPVSTDPRTSKYGYWANLVFSGIDRVRRDFSDKQKFFECSGYLFAIRNGVIEEFPMDASEDSILPYLFWKKGYKIKYIEKAEVYVKNPGNWKDWLNQKIRNIKGHENLNKLAPDLPRTKSLFNEIKYGFFYSLLYPRNFKELLWTFELYFARLYIYLRAFKEISKNKSYSDGWREVETESTKPLD
jgi:cellulose synthase/poly-beta-1,6-N-acetylglucosamine synthase-like glycosyltransferase